MAQPTLRYFPAPWIAIELQEAFRIEDANGFALAYVYFAEDPQRQSVTGRLSKDEARRIAINMASVPDLRRALRDQDLPRRKRGSEPESAEVNPPPR